MGRGGTDGPANGKLRSGSIDPATLLFGRAIPEKDGVYQEDPAALPEPDVTTPPHDLESLDDLLRQNNAWVRRHEIEQTDKKVDELRKRLKYLSERQDELYKGIENKRDQIREGSPEWKDAAARHEEAKEELRQTSSQCERLEKIRNQYEATAAIGAFPVFGLALITIPPPFSVAVMGAVLAGGFAIRRLLTRAIRKKSMFAPETMEIRHESQQALEDLYRLEDKFQEAIAPDDEELAQIKSELGQVNLDLQEVLQKQVVLAEDSGLSES